MTAHSQLHIAFHEFEENITRPGQKLPASQKQTSYRENMKSQFNVAAVWRLCLHWKPDRNYRLQLSIDDMY